MDAALVLSSKIVERTAKVAVIGQGYVGLPLTMAFTEAGFTTFGLDNNVELINRLREGLSHIPDVPDFTVRQSLNKGLYYPTTDYNALADCDVAIICVPTPLRKSKDPDVSYIVAAVTEIKTRLHRPMLVILESTTYPGTTEELIQAEVEKQGLLVGQDIFLCFSPERVDPGNPVYHTTNTPKVIGGVTPECTRMGSLLYGQVMSKVIPVTSARVAEMVKLLENTFRAVNIGLINEMAQMCERMGIDIWEVIDAAATKPFGFMAFHPGPGIGGHCIPLDPAYLAWKAKMYNFYNRFIELASDVNGNMPHHVVRLIADILNLEGKALAGSNVLCLGLAYKRDVNDTRESPALDVIHLLIRQGVSIQYSDPYVPEYEDKEWRAESVPLTAEAVKHADCVVILTDHSKFDYRLIANQARLILDTRNAMREYCQPNLFRIGSPLPRVSEWRKIRENAAEAAAAKE